MAEILVVDDEELMRDLISASLTRIGHRVRVKRNGQEALEAFEPGRYDLIISDFKMPGMTGLELAEKLIQAEPQLSMVLMTAFGTIENAVKAMKLGVKDFIEKPFQIEILEHTVAQVLRLRSLEGENRRLRTTLESRYRFVGETGIVQELLRTVDEVAASNSTVLITGESGTGKEMLAQSIHLRSKRAEKPFVKINCAAIPESLIESELFGHEKGAYTGAIRTRVGKFEQAQGGTLMLDEVGEMPLFAQSKLLRVLQEKEITKVGGSDEIAIDVRIIAVTNRNLEEEVRKGTFREDLYYRLNVIPIKVPPLRERMGDVESLAGHFVGKYNNENGFQVEGFTPEALQRVKQHAWPGNVRELENVIQRAVVFAKSGDIRPEDLRLEAPVLGNTPREVGLFAGMTVAEAEKLLIVKTLEACGENRTKAADMLNISIRTLRNKLNEYKLKET